MQTLENLRNKPALKISLRGPSLDDYWKQRFPSEEPQILNSSYRQTFDQELPERLIFYQGVVRFWMKKEKLKNSEFYGPNLAWGFLQEQKLVFVMALSKLCRGMTSKFLSGEQEMKSFSSLLAFAGNLEIRNSLMMERAWCLNCYFAEYCKWSHFLALINFNMLSRSAEI